jgi:hypothetical protein
LCEFYQVAARVAHIKSWLAGDRLIVGNDLDTLRAQAVFSERYVPNCETNVAFRLTTSLGFG